MKFQKSPPLPERTLERRLQELELLAQERSFVHIQKMVGVISGIVGYLSAENISLKNYTLILGGGGWGIGYAIGYLFS